MDKFTVLSIDLDYIMEPCIELYNDIIDNDLPMDSKKNCWAMLNKFRKIDQIASVNNKNVINLFNAFHRYLYNVKPENISFSNHHNKIMDRLMMEGGSGKKIDLFNIDHHHDIHYNEEQTEEVDLQDTAGVGNWVWLLDKFNYLDRYVWIKNENSMLFDPVNEFVNAEGENVKVARNLSCRFIETLEHHLLPEKVDYLFVCASDMWMPEKFRHYFNLMLSAANNYHNTIYQVHNPDTYKYKLEKEKV